jgi:hypothetical protein
MCAHPYERTGGAALVGRVLELLDHPTVHFCCFFASLTCFFASLIVVASMTYICLQEHAR